MSRDAFMADRKTQDAVIRNLEIIGEAVKRLSPSLTRAYPDVPWRQIAGMRDKLTHDFLASISISCGASSNAT